MQNWQKKRNYKKCKNTDGSFTHIITVDGEDIEVTAEVFKAYSQADRRERYCTERDIGRTLSLDLMTTIDDFHTYLPSRYVESAEDTAIRAILAELAWKTFTSLGADEQDLIHALIIEDITEREYAASVGLSQKGINKKKQKIIKKIKKVVLNQ